MSDDQFRGRYAGPDGSQPRAKSVSNKFWRDNRQILKQALCDDSGLYEDMIGVELAFDGVAIR